MSIRNSSQLYPWIICKIISTSIHYPISDYKYSQRLCLLNFVKISLEEFWVNQRTELTIFIINKIITIINKISVRHEPFDFSMRGGIFVNVELFVICTLILMDDSFIDQHTTSLFLYFSWYWHIICTSLTLKEIIWLDTVK